MTKTLKSFHFGYFIKQMDMERQIFAHPRMKWLASCWVAAHFLIPLAFHSHSQGSSVCAWMHWLLSFLMVTPPPPPLLLTFPLERNVGTLLKVYPLKWSLVSWAWCRRRSFAQHEWQLEQLSCAGRAKHHSMTACHAWLFFRAADKFGPVDVSRVARLTQDDRICVCAK